MKQNFFFELIERLRSDSPKFFIVIQNIAIVVLGLAGAIAALKEIPVDLPSWALWIDKTVAAVSATALIIARLPKQDAPQAEQPKIEQP